MTAPFITAVDRLIREAPVSWLAALCAVIKQQAGDVPHRVLLQRLPPTNNADLAFLAGEVVKQARGRMSWEALGWAIEAAGAIHQRLEAAHQLELLWSGPHPTAGIPARRIDQALYDLIAQARGKILLVTFVAVKIERLAAALTAAIQRGVKVLLVLEFKGSSEGQLNYDALAAFPDPLIRQAEVYYWPVEKRRRNAAGRPGKLHAKVAVIDDLVLVSSANLTDDAFSRNLELGVMIRDADFHSGVTGHIAGLIQSGDLVRLK